MSTSLYIEAAKAGRDQVRTAISATVLAYNASRRTADVRLDVGFWWRDTRGTWREGAAQELAEVPVAMPFAAGRGLVFGLEVGARVLLLVRERSHDELDAGDAAPVVPGSRRRFDLSDALVLPFGGARADIPAARSDGQPVLALPSGEALHVGNGTASRAVALADDTKARLDQLQAAFDAHTHPFVGVAVGAPGVTSMAVPVVGTLAPVGSARLKVDG